MSKMKTLEELFIGQIQDLYSAEDQLIKALPKMAKLATDKNLKMTIEEHLEETKAQRDRLVQILDDHDEKAGEETCKAMQGLIKEAEEHLAEDMTPEVRDALLIACAQRVEHYEISGYGTAATYAQMLDMPEHAELLQMTLDEEKMADEKLNDIAMSSVNEKANQEGSGMSMSGSKSSSSSNGKSGANGKGGSNGKSAASGKSSSSKSSSSSSSSSSGSKKKETTGSRK